MGRSSSKKAPAPQAARTASTKPKTRAQWAAEIRAVHTQTVETILKLGLMLSAAKKALAHGEFLKMIEHDLPFTASVAQRLMKIAADPKIANAARAQLLPSSWTVLYEVSKLPAETFDIATALGKINPKMTRDDVKTIKADVTVLPFKEPQHVRLTVRGYQKNEVHQRLVELSEPEMAQEYTALIKQHQLYEGACELPWSRYFDYRDAHPDECSPLTNDDLAYVWQWTHAGPAPESVDDDDDPTDVKDLSNNLLSLVPHIQDLLNDLLVSMHQLRVAKRNAAWPRAIEAIDGEVALQEIKLLYDKLLADYNAEEIENA
jgi:hypothetical protein